MNLEEFLQLNSGIFVVGNIRPTKPFGVVVKTVGREGIDTRVLRNVIIPDRSFI